MRPVQSRWLVLLLALALYAGTTHRRIFTAGNDAARWATIESIVERGTTAIDGSRFAGTVDQVRLDGHLYANKPPLLAIAGAAVYAPLRALTGWTLENRGAANVLHVVVLLLVGLPAALLAARFHSTVAESAVKASATSPPGVVWMLTAGLAAGTLLWPFATTLNAHVPAAMALFFSFLAAKRGAGLRAGLWCGIAAALDLLPGAGLAPFFFWLLWREKRAQGGGRFGAGFFAAMSLAALANWAHHGALLPIKMVAGAVDLSASAGPSLLGVVLPERASYPLEVLFGGHGLFTVSPILLFGVAGLWIACRRDSPERLSWRLLAAGVALQVVAHALLAGSYGGWSYGFRYLLPIQAFFSFTALFALQPPRRWVAPAFAGALAISILFAALGVYHPWPPAYEQEANRHPVASLVTNPIGGNAAAWLVEHSEGSALSRWATSRFVSDDPDAARAYFALFFLSKGDFETARRFAR
jgi:hypothetical protein